MAHDLGRPRELEARAHNWAYQLPRLGRVADGVSTVGGREPARGGTAHPAPFAGPAGGQRPPQRAAPARKLRSGQPPVVARIERQALAGTLA